MAAEIYSISFCEYANKFEYLVGYDLLLEFRKTYMTIYCKENEHNLHCNICSCNILFDNSIHPHVLLTIAKKHHKKAHNSSSLLTALEKTNKESNIAIRRISDCDKISENSINSAKRKLDEAKLRLSIVSDVIGNNSHQIVNQSSSVKSEATITPTEKKEMKIRKKLEEQGIGFGYGYSN